ncbi:YdcF family protein [Niallia sp. Krafla_26]|uniref:YdcF family protein n=1 Tax=Niallia sp. Krafla_26 TaxID=3064703 RepID=UPI003D16C0FE
MKKKKRFMAIGIILVIAVFMFLRFGGDWLVEEDDIEEIEDAVIVLLMGSVGDRALGAVDLYKEGKAESILMVRSHLPGYEELQERGITISGDVDNSRIVLVESGVAAKDITIISGDAQSTQDEAVAIEQYLKNKQDVDKILLVTSRFHSKRSELIFEKALADLDVDIYSAPTPYDPYQARGWYKDREDIQRVITEYIKLANYFVLEQWEL